MSTKCRDTTTCQSKFKDKNCKCVTTNTSKKGDGTIETTCAYEEGGVLYGCSIGCCQNQCGGQCPDNKNNIFLNLGDALPTNMTRRWGLAILVLLISMILISTVSLMK